MSQNNSIMKVTIPIVLHDKVKLYATTAGLTQGQVVEMILEDYFFEKNLAATMKTIIEIGDLETEADDGI